MKKVLTIAGILTTGLSIPSLAYAQEVATTTATQTGLGQVSTFGELVSLMWSYGSNVIIAMAIFFIVLGAGKIIIKKQGILIMPVNFKQLFHQFPCVNADAGRSADRAAIYSNAHNYEFQITNYEFN